MAGKVVKTVIEKKNRNLLLNSDIIEQHPKLKEILEAHESVKDEDLQGYSKQLITKIIHGAESEWIGDQKRYGKDLGKTDSIPCSLCGTSTRYIYYIVNKITGITLNVGGTCVTKFDSVILGDLGKMTQAKREKFLTKISKEEKISEAIPGIIELNSSLYDYFDRSILLIPYVLEKEYLKYAGEIRSNYLKYLSDDYDIGSFMEFKNQIEHCIKKLEEIKDSVQRYIHENENDEFIPKRDIVTWLQRNGRITVIGWLKEDCKISARTGPKIGERTFLKSLVLRINKYFKNAGFMISETKDSEFIFETKLKGIRLIMGSQPLLSGFWNDIFSYVPSISPSHDSIKDFLKNAQLHKDDYNRFNVKLSFNGLYGYDDETRSIVVRIPNTENKVVELDAKTVFKDLLYHVLIQPFSEEQITQYFSQKCKGKAGRTIKDYENLKGENRIEEIKR